MTNQNIETIKRLMDDFRVTIFNRTLSNIFYSDLFENLLGWHFLIWTKEMSYLGQGDKSIDVWSQYYQLLSTLSVLLDDITGRVLIDNSMSIYSFFEQFSKHIDSHKEEFRLVKKDNSDLKYMYIEQVFSHFLPVLFEKIADSPCKFSIWENYFPKNWLITYASLNSEGIINHTILNRFFDFAISRIGAANKNDFDKQLNEISEELFPEVDPVRWAKILTFILSPYDPSHRVDSIVRRPWTFGLTGRVRAFSGYTEDDQKFQQNFSNYLQSIDDVEKVATYKLATSLFKDQFTESNLALYITEANNLKYEHGSEEEKKRDRLLLIFKEMREFHGVGGMQN
ncbi:MAG: hypothetical protein NT077_03345 [Candidatus Taylorbacteria bacterium]|nr:hypothetical protein [Candidatus Taylorbacteria bacterium]